MKRNEKKIVDISSATSAAKLFQPKSSQWVLIRGELLPILQLSRKTGTNTFNYNPQNHQKVKQLYGEAPTLIPDDLWEIEMIETNSQKRKRENVQNVYNINSKQRRLSENLNSQILDGSEVNSDSVETSDENSVEKGEAYSVEKSEEISTESSSDTEEIINRQKQKKYGN